MISPHTWTPLTETVQKPCSPVLQHDDLRHTVLNHFLSYGAFELASAVDYTMHSSSPECQRIQNAWMHVQHRGSVSTRFLGLNTSLCRPLVALYVCVHQVNRHLLGKSYKYNMSLQYARPQSLIQFQHANGCCQTNTIPARQLQFTLSNSAILWPVREMTV